MDVLDCLQKLFPCLFRGNIQRGDVLHFRNSGISVFCDQSSSELSSDRVLGEGAFSTVFVAEDANPSYGRPVQRYAVKRMFLQTEEFEKIYKEEISSFKRFSHPNIMQIIDSSEIVDANRHCKVAYLLFPLMRGSLRDQLNETVLQPRWHDVSPDRSRWLLGQTLAQYLEILEAFAVLHSAEPAYVHQDIKPENILILTRNHEGNIPKSSSSDDHNSMELGQAKGGRGSPSPLHLSLSLSNPWEGGTSLLTDFGSVRKATVPISTRRDALRVADEASSMCTVSYRAPELFDPPKGLILDTRTDVWGLGCLLFAMWFGYSPYESDFGIDDRGNCVVKVADCSHSRVLSPMPRKPEKYCSAEDIVVMRISEWILEQDMTKRPFTSDIITAVQEELGRQTSS